jgi:hypothetical protein
MFASGERVIAGGDGATLHDPPEMLLNTCPAALESVVTISIISDTVILRMWLYLSVYKTAYA